VAYEFHLYRAKKKKKEKKKKIKKDRIHISACCRLLFLQDTSEMDTS